MSLDRLLDERRLLITVGPGGVGKTTTAAALGLRAAQRGKRVLVLTIDPARRLADALGLDGLDDAAHRVPLEPLGPGAVRAGGELHAAMLDTKASYDALIRRIAEPDAAARIFANRAYQAFSRTMARSHAYVAMERLHHELETERWDLLVLDTPPTRSALDILDAPGRLTRFLEARAVEGLLRASTSGGLLPIGASAATRLLARLVGDSSVTELLSFFAALAHLREGFRHRAARVGEVLLAPEAAFVLVASSSATSLEDAGHLRDGLLERSVPIAALVFNRAFVPEPDDPSRPVAAPRDAPPAPLPDGAPPAFAARLRAIRASTARENEAAFAAMEAFRRALPDSGLALALPRFEEDVRDLPGLARLLSVPFAWRPAVC